MFEEDETYEQMSLFDDILLDKVITKPIRLVSFFSGIEAQYKALSFLGKELNIPVESYKTCEWAYNSIVACNAIHNRDFTNYSEGKSKQEMIERIRGISVDYNKPLTDEQLNKKPLSWIQSAYNNIIANHDLINIMSVKGEDLGIVDTEHYEYICTYSFPCQDLSLAGKRAGMEVSQAEGGTRSGLLWEFERILTEIKDSGKEMPQILIMENVPQIHSEKDYPNFVKWQNRLTDLGYTSYWEDLNGKNFGVPQNRERTFMVSILNEKDGSEYNYKFPQPFKRDFNLKDFLETNVDEKYYLSKKMVDYLTGINQKESKYDRASVFERNLDPRKDVACTITTAAGQRATDNFILEDREGFVEDHYKNFIEKEGKIPEMFNPYHEKEITDTAPTLTTNCGTTTASSSCLIAEKHEVELKRGYSVSVKEASDKPVDGVDSLGSYSKCGYNQTAIVGENGIAPTVTENHGEVTAVAEYGRKALNETLDKFEGQITDGTFIDAYDRTIYHEHCNTITTRIDACNNYFVAEDKNKSIPIREATIKGYKEAYEGDGIDIGPRMKHHRGNVQDGLSQTLKTSLEVGVVVKNKDLRIRKLTPKECMRLMSFQDIDCDHMLEVGLTNSAIYHCAGDSIIVAILVGIMAKLFGLSNKETEKVIKKYISTIKE